MREGGSESIEGTITARQNAQAGCRTHALVCAHVACRCANQLSDTRSSNTDLRISGAGVGNRTLIGRGIAAAAVGVRHARGYGHCGGYPGHRRQRPGKRAAERARPLHRLAPVGFRAPAEDIDRTDRRDAAAPCRHSGVDFSRRVPWDPSTETSAERSPEPLRVPGRAGVSTPVCQFSCGSGARRVVPAGP